jgi:hypothetical protein
MADFNIQPIGTEVRPIQGMSLGDMINVARGAQTYQQAEQTNPLALQQQQQVARTGQIQLSVAEQADKERRNMQTFFADPKNYQTDGRIDIDKINAEVPKIAPLTGSEYITKFTNLGNAQTTAEKATLELGQSDRELFANPISILGRAGVKDPKAYAKVIKETVDLNKNNPRLAALGNSYLTQLEFADPNQLPDIAIRAAQNLLSPAQQQTAFTPSVQTTEAGATVTTMPGVGAAKPTVEIGRAGGLQGPTTPVSGETQAAPNMGLRYPVRTADQPFRPEPGEEKDAEAGFNFRNKLIGAQSSLAQNRRNVEEVIGQVNTISGQLKQIEREGGKPFEIGQKIRRAFGDTNYDMLAKDLANLSLSNIQAMGGVSNTVAGLDMQQVANGTIKVPPDVLIKIARRVEADQTNLDMQANGAERFSKRFGDNNMRKYQQDWNANADTRIFEAINIYNTTADPEKRKEQIDTLLGKKPERDKYKTNAEFEAANTFYEKKRKGFFDKYQNIQKLSKTGSL